MTNLNTDSQLENELQELYILAGHWSADLDFLEEELQFFKNVVNRYPAARVDEIYPQETFRQKVQELELHLADLRVKIPHFLNFLSPFIADLNKPMDLSLLELYNTLLTELQSLFKVVRATKKQLFAQIESIIPKAN
jgi:hypothetical protein